MRRECYEEPCSSPKLCHPERSEGPHASWRFHQPRREFPSLLRPCASAVVSFYDTALTRFGSRPMFSGRTLPVSAGSRIGDTLVLRLPAPAAAGLGLPGSASSSSSLSSSLTIGLSANFRFAHQRAAELDEALLLIDDVSVAHHFFIPEPEMGLMLREGIAANLLSQG